jgi:hypothetical protein
MLSEETPSGKKKIIVVLGKEKQGKSNFIK